MIRRLYPSESKFGVRGVGHRGRQLPVPTHFAAGTPGKVLVLQARAKAGQLLHHPLDGVPAAWFAFADVADARGDAICGG